MRVGRRQMVLSAAVGSVLAACGVSGGGTTADTAGAAAPSRGPVTLRYMQQWSALYQDRLDKVLADFTTRYTTIRAESVRTGDVQKELATLLAAGTPPDVAMQWRGAMPGLAIKKGFIALDPYLKRDKFDPAIYYENEYKTSQFLGKTYVLPAAATGAWYLIFYNRDHFRDAGLDETKPPATWADAIRYTAALNKTGDGKIQRLGFEPGFKDAGIFNSPFVAWTSTNAGKFASDDGRKLTFDGPQAIGALDWMLQMLKQIGGRDALEEYLTRNRVVSETFTTTGTRAMYLTNHSFPARLKAVSPDLRYGIGALPRGSDKGVTGIVRGGWSNGIPAGVKAENESWLLTQYLSATREGGGWFMQEQIRPSPIKAVNESPGYNELPHWEVIKKALGTDTIVAQTPLDIEIDKLTAAAVTEVYEGKTDVKAAVAFAQKEGQRQLDEFWAGVAR